MKTKNVSDTDVKRGRKDASCSIDGLQKKKVVENPNPNEKSESARTGDRMPIAGWLVAMVAATIHFCQKKKDLKTKNITEKRCKNRKIILFSLLKNKKSENANENNPISKMFICDKVLLSNQFRIYEGGRNYETKKSSGYSIGRSNDF